LLVGAVDLVLGRLGIDTLVARAEVNVELLERQQFLLVELAQLLNLLGHFLVDRGRGVCLLFELCVACLIRGKQISFPTSSQQLQYFDGAIHLLLDSLRWLLILGGLKLFDGILKRLELTLDVILDIDDSKDDFAHLFAALSLGILLCDLCL